jgi:cystathionine beta-lyase/cystathionine gamma-synthase
MIGRAAELAATFGLTGNPFESWLAMRGMATLDLRMTRASATALGIAVRLEEHPGVARVYYPLLPSHPDFALAKHLLRSGGGAMVTIDLQTRGRAEAFFRAMAGSVPFAPSLGDVQTTLSHPATTSHRGQDAAAMARQGINAGMVRVSIGLEDPEDLWREFRDALEAIGSP